MAFYKITGGAKDYTNVFIEHAIEGKYTNSITNFIGSHAFRGNSKLEKVSFPRATRINSYAFYGCTNLNDVSIPLVSIIESHAFELCGDKLKTITIPLAGTISDYAFKSCTSFVSLFLPSASMCVLGTNVFSMSPFSSRATIYVPSSLMSEYKSATNWTSLSTRFSAIEDYVPE